MEPSTNVFQMLSSNTIFVPDYQRAYSWDTETVSTKKPRHVNTFLSDLQDYIKGKSSSPYYFGHFLFEEKENNSFGIIDGQQRLTTITIFLAALFRRLKELRSLSDEEDFAYKSMIKVGQNYHFTTVDYDKLLFRDYVINQTKSDHNGLDTKSQQRIVAAYDFFVTKFANMSEAELIPLLHVVKNASCTTHVVKNETEAIQMFIFQNNRGKKPSKLENIKALFLYNVHLYGGDEKDDLSNVIRERFEYIYRTISKIEHKIDEDDVLTYTSHIYFNSLLEIDVMQRINEKLNTEDRINFIEEFTIKLQSCFENTLAFLDKEKKDIIYHSLLVSGDKSLMFPFIIKALSYHNISIEDMHNLAKSLESIFIRSRVIGTRADLASRLNGVFKKFAGDITVITNKIDWMKTQKDWWGYWNNKHFEQALQGEINHKTAKILLWQYENYLIRTEGKSGYAPIRYDAIEKPHLEHIAPQTENKVRHGYDEYDDEFRNQYLDCLGNYLLLSAPHNLSIGNIAFKNKRSTYTKLLQQQEVCEMTKTPDLYHPYWDREKIRTRKEKIVKFLLETF